MTTISFPTYQFTPQFLLGLRSMFKSFAGCFVFAIATLIPALWSSGAQAIYVRHDLAQVGTAGVGLDDYEALGAAHAATGYFWSGGQWCTGTIVGYGAGTTNVLTAAHCVAPFDANNDNFVSASEAAGLSFQLGLNGNLNGAGSAVLGAWYPNTYTGPQNPDDVAVVRINANAAAFGNVIAAYSFTTPASVLGFQSEFVGWGNQGTGLAAGAGGPPTSVTDGFGYTADDKLGAQNIIDSTFNGMMVTDFDDPGNADGVNPLGGAFPLNFEGTTAGGDSGGPLIPVGLAPGSGTIVGVLSDFLLVNANCVGTSLYNDCSAWAPLSANQAFLTAQLVPVPPAVWLFGTALMTLLGIKRRRVSP